MKRLLYSLFSSYVLVTTLLAAERPTGQGTPEGVACDAIQAYADCDSKAWLKILIRPIFGEEKNKTYAEFKKQMIEHTDGNKGKEGFVAPRIVKVYKARNFSKNGPGSMAYALHEITGNMFVDVVIEVGGGRLQSIRYHVMLDKDKKWYFEPRPDLAGLLAMGINNEKPSKEVLWELKPEAKEKEKADK